MYSIIYIITCIIDRPTHYMRSKGYQGNNNEKFYKVSKYISTKNFKYLSFILKLMSFLMTETFQIFRHVSF